MTKVLEQKRRPWLKFFPADWQADEGLAQCSLSARGLWIEMIAVMHKSKIFGHLLVAGQKPTEQQLAVQVKSDVKSVRLALEELEKWGVFSRTEDGTIYSRRMLADAKREQRDAENGRGGGNPKLRLKSLENPIGGVKQGVNPTDNEGENGPDKAHILYAICQSKSVAAQLPAVPAGDAAESSVRAEIFREGISTLRRLCQNSDKAARSFLGQMLKELGGRDTEAKFSAMLAIIREADHAQPADPPAWIAAAVKVRAASRTSPPANAALMPARNDPPERWMHLADGAELDRDGVTKPTRAGWYLHEIAELVCIAAKIPNEDWRIDWSPLILWLDAGLHPHDRIIPSIRRAAERSTYRPPATLKYFDAMVRAEAAMAHR